MSLEPNECIQFQKMVADVEMHIELVRAPVEFPNQGVCHVANALHCHRKSVNRDSFAGQDKLDFSCPAYAPVLGPGSGPESPQIPVRGSTRPQIGFTACRAALALISEIVTGRKSHTSTPTFTEFWLPRQLP